MAEITVESLARMVGLPSSKLLDRLRQAGIDLKDVHDVVSEDQKRKFLQFLRTGYTQESDGDLIRKQPATSTPKTNSQSLKSAAIATANGIQVKVIRKRVSYDQLETDTEEEAYETAATRSSNTKTNTQNEVKNKSNPKIAIKADGKLEGVSDALTKPKESKSTNLARGNKKNLKGSGDKFNGDAQLSRKNNPRREIGFPVDHNFYGEDDDDGAEGNSELISKAGRVLGGENSKNKTREYRFRSDRRKAIDINNSHAKAVGSSATHTENAGSRLEARGNILVKIPESIEVNKLAQRMSLKNSDLIKAMLDMGVMATVNQVLDQDTAALVASEMGFKVELQKDMVLDDNTILTERQDVAKLPRAPVVTIMGHVDHGKTSLLDYIRRTKVAAKEAGGITQRIGAYRVETKKGDITFLDTPGHEAFTAMRARGAQCTDIVVLIVAADDGVMPQTVEAIQHAKAAKVPIIVAINKIDKPGADPEKIRTELANYEVISEQWGGDTIFQNISAKRGDGVDELLDDILMVAEMQQLTAPVDCYAKGVVLESHLDKGLGPVAAVLVREGTLKVGDIALVGCYFGKVRGIFDDNHVRIKTAGPSVPVEILGLSGVPSAGDSLMVLPSEKQARDVALIRQQKQRDSKLTQQQHLKMEQLLAQMKNEASADGDASGDTAAKSSKNFNVVLKADLQGSVEAIKAALTKLKVDGVNIEVIGSGVGNITSSDVNLAKASHGVVIGFNVHADSNARNLAESEGIDIRYYDIIYQLLEEIQNAMSGMLAPKYQEEILGVAKVKEVFRSSKFGAIAGCRVVSGNLKRGGSIRVSRDGKALWEGEINSMRVVKDDVNEVHQGVECGIGAKGFSDFKVGDQIEQYKKVLVKAASSG